MLVFLDFYFDLVFNHSKSSYYLIVKKRINTLLTKHD